jgi:hypothetical protein
MKTCPQCQKQIDDDLSSCQCGHQFSEAFPPTPLRTQSAPVAPPASADPRHIIGGILVALGIVLVAYFAFGYDTMIEVSVPVPDHTYSLPEHVQNMGLEINRIIGVMVGLAVSLAGFVLIAAPSPKK